MIRRSSARPLDRDYVRLDMIRKTSLLRKIEPIVMRSSVTNKDAVTQSNNTGRLATPDATLNHLAMLQNERPGDSARIRNAYLAICLAIQARIDLLFTMSEITHADVLVKTVCTRNDVSRTMN